MRTRPFAALFVLGALVAASAGAARVAELPEKWRKWLEDEVYPLITSEQRQAFLALADDAQR